jgi:hypothetical protein
MLVHIPAFAGKDYNSRGEGDPAKGPNHGGGSTYFSVSL